jgi:uncharacterized protein YndB with AHSA1/START domain
MASDFDVTTDIAKSPQLLYDAWLDSDGHSKMTGSPAEVSANPGGQFKAWDGYIWGENLELEPGKRIVQSWRTSEFTNNEEDSQIEVLFEDNETGGTKITLRHTNLPEHGAQYEQGWQESYFDPMKLYFEG